MKDTSQGNCPNCGAPLTGSTCGYCGTRHAIDLSVLDGKNVKVSFDHLGIHEVFEMYVTYTQLEYHWDSYSDIQGKLFMIGPRVSVGIHGEVIPFRHKEVV